ncbi:MAG: DUF4347 domain-containing protein, partial [Rhodocyclaceae bacterium]|nr:DUF4347 domain-containing protein [Rhodocyclaceae bacterium]
MAVRARRTLAAEELEARVLFSADLAPHAGIDSALVAHHRDQEQDGAIEVAFVDAGLENVGGLLAALQAEEGGGRTLEIVMLEPDGDGIDQIGNALAQYRDVSAIHLFTHGGNGRLALGSVDLDDATLASRSTEIAAWGDALGTDADLLIYGCDVAEDEAGQAFVRDLAALTGADVAASDDLTGAATLGGDWDLEFRVGEVASPQLFSISAVQAWSGLLDITTGLVGHFTFDEGSGTIAGDSSATGNDGTLLSGPTWVAGRVGSGALNFGGDFDRVEVPDSAAYDLSGDFSVSFWFNSAQTPSSQVRLVGQSAGSDGFVVFTDSFGDINWFVTGSGGSTTFWTAAPLDSNWHLFTAVRSGDNFELFIDGASAATDTTAIGDASSSEPLRFGASSASSGDYDGLVDDVRIYDRALGAGDISELYSYTGVSVDVTVTTITDNNDAGVVAGNATHTVSWLLANRGTDGNISLREAVIAANNTIDPVSITLGSGTHTLSVTGQFEDAATTGDLDITRDITIQGAGAGSTTISGAGISDRIFDVKGGGLLTLADLTVADANTTNIPGGGVYSTGILSATNVVFDNLAVTNADGGAVYIDGGAATLTNSALINNSATNGGALSVNGGTTTLINVTISGNTAEFNGAGIEALAGTLNLEHVTIANNSISNIGGGGGLFSNGATVNMRYSIGANNSAPNPEQDIDGAIVSGGYNIIENAIGVTGLAGTDTTGSDGGIAATLTADGGTHVHAITTSSAAYGAATGSTQTVDQRGVTRDANPDIGAYEYVPPAPQTFVVTNTNDSGSGSLRQAILDANASGGADTIEFAIGSGTQTISLSSALPQITEGVVLDAWTQPGYSGTPRIIIDANQLAATAFDLTATADGSTIRGFVLRDFSGSAINIQAGSDNHAIVGNYIGSFGAGGTDLGAGEANGGEGIAVAGANNTIGGSTPAERNVIGGNTYGISIIDATASGNIVIGNYIGVDASGTGAVANSRAGVYFSSSASNNVVGGTAPGSGNVIANSAWDGVRVNSGTGNAVLGNRIYDNTEQGIDIGAQGLSTNDGGDADTGSNNGQNFPVLASVATDGSTQITIAGTLNSDANSHYRIEFFANASADGTGHGEGQTYLGFANVATDGAGNATIDTTLAASVPAGAYISATATKSDSSYVSFTDSSEFAAVVVANAVPSDIVFDSDAGSEIDVNTYTTTDQIDPAIAALADGGYIVTWVSNTPADNYNIYAKVYNADGSVRIADFLVTGEVGDAETNPSVTTFGDGGFVVAWQDQTSGVRAWTEARVFNADGTPATAEFQVSPGADGDNEGYQPAVLALSDSEFVAVWANETAGSTYEVVGQRFDLAGSTVGAQFTVGSLASGTGLFGAQVELAKLDDGGFVAVWRTHDGTTTAVSARVMNADGSARSALLLPGGDNVADVAALASGGFVVTYDDAGALKATVYDAGGAVVVSEFQVNTTASAARYESTVTASDDGFVVVWESDSGDGGGTAILAQRFDAGGNKIDGEVVVNQTTAGDQKKPEAAVTASGQVIAVWQSDNVDGDATGIVMRLVTTGSASVPENSANGTRVADVTGVFDADVGDTHTFDLTDDAGGRFAIDANTGVITVADGSLLDYETSTSHTVTVRVTDSGVSSYSEVLTIAVEDVADTNSAPSFGVTLDGNPTFVEGGAAVVLDANVDVSDAELDALNGGDGNYAGASLTLARNGGADADDTFGFSDGNGISLAAANLVKNGQVIATFDTTGTSGQLAIVFTDGNGEVPTSADVDNVLRQITYANGSDAPPASVQIDWTFDDGNSGAQGSGGALQALGSTTVNITGVNDAPSGSANTISAIEDTAYTLAVADFGFGDVDGDNLLRVWIDTLPAQGQLLWNGASFAAGNWIDAGDIDLGLLTYEPPAGTSGASLASFTFRVQDDGGTANGGQDTEAVANTMTIDVAAANPPMSATDDFLSTLEDTPLVFDPTSNDVASQGGAVTLVEFTQPTNGAVVDNGDGTLTYTPDPGYTGGDSFDYVIVDADANATLSHYWNLDGTATDGVGSSDGTLNGTTTVAGSIGNGLSFNESGDYVQIPDITYGAEFTISFDFKLDDNSGGLFQYLYSHGNVSGFNSVNVFVNEASHPSDPNVLRTVIRDGDDSLDNFALQFDISSIVGDGQWHTYTATVDAGGIKVYLDGDLKMSDATRGTGGVNPTGDLYVGSRQDLDVDRYYGGALDSLRIYDSALVDSEVAVMANSSTGTVNITVDPGSTATPVANADAITVAEGGTATSLDSAATSVLANDAGLGDTPVTVSLVTDVSFGSLTLNADGTFTYTHDGTENFSDSFTYRVTDNDGETSDATVSITITPVSDQTPVANADSITVAEGGTATSLDSAATSVLANDAGLGDTPVTVSLVTDVSFGSLTLNADGTFSYTHDGTENFSDSFTYRVTDNDGETSDATVSITITPVSDATPVANADAITVAEGGTATALDTAATSVLANDAGLGDTPVTVSLVTD